jgi:hypothetical protein
MRPSTIHFPTIAAGAEFDQSALVHAHRTGVNAVELDLLSQVISRLARDHSTVVPAAMKTDLVEMECLGYLQLTPTSAGTLSVALLCPGPLLSNYFWSVWVPRHLFDCSLKIGVLPNLPANSEAQHCTVVFRIPGEREASRLFLTDLSTKFPGHDPEIIAIEAGNRLLGATQ